MVLPCMPAMAMPYFRRINSASISARWITGNVQSCALRRPRDSPRAIAELVTTTSAPATFSAAWPQRSIAPSSASRSVTAELLQIGAGNLVAEVQQHLGDAAHADAADADEMNALNFGKHKSSSGHGFDAGFITDFEPEHHAKQ